MEEMMVETVEAPETQETEQVESQEITTEGQQEQTPEDPYSPKSSSEYAKWLKGIRDSDPANGKFARMAKDDHARLYQLNQMEKRGIDGVRETYALLDSVQHGEVKGVEAVAAMQDELRSVAEIDERLFSGDHTALTEMGEEFVQQALPKLVGPILDMVRQSNPEAYQSAILPHLVESLKSSPVVGNFNAMVDVLNENMPNWLPEDKKGAWQADKMQRILSLAAQMGGAFNALQEKAGQLKPVEGKPNGKPALNEERAAFDKERQEHHWSTNINPKLDQHAAGKFREMFTPYDKRLRLDATAKNGLMNEFSKRVASKAAANPVYTSQIGRYRAAKNPDPGAVVNYAKVEFDKHAKNVMEGLIKERYSPFLSGKQGTTQNGNGAKPGNGAARPAVGPGVQIVAVKPAMQDIDHKNTPLDWLHQQKYRMKSGKVVQVRNN